MRDFMSFKEIFSKGPKAPSVAPSNFVSILPTGKTLLVQMSVNKKSKEWYEIIAMYRGSSISGRKLRQAVRKSIGKGDGTRLIQGSLKFVEYSLGLSVVTESAINQKDTGYCIALQPSEGPPIRKTT